MKLPLLFRDIHGTQIFNLWSRLGHPPFVRIVPQEPLGGVSVGAPRDVMPDSTVTIITMRCWNDRGVMGFEAAGAVDLKVAQEWAQRHKDTPPDEFKWFPKFAANN